MAPTQSFNCIIGPFDKFWDLSQKADQEHWLVASKAASDHVRFDVSVATAEQFLELLKDKSEYFRWGLLMQRPYCRQWLVRRYQGQACQWQGDDENRGHPEG
jgi:hypothetical protein